MRNKRACKGFGNLQHLVGSSSPLYDVVNDVALQSTLDSYDDVRPMRSRLSYELLHFRGVVRLVPLLGQHGDCRSLNRGKHLLPAFLFPLTGLSQFART